MLLQLPAVVEQIPMDLDRLCRLHHIETRSGQQSPKHQGTRLLQLP